MKVELTKDEIYLITDLILAELETARKFRFRFTNKNLRYETSQIENRLMNIHGKLCQIDFRGAE